MNKKRVLGILFVVLTIYIISFVLAEELSVDESYACLEEQLGTNCGGTKNTEQAAFNLLAIAYDSGLQADCRALLNQLESDNCWGDSESGVCKIKPTALSILALNYIEDNVDANVEWLLDKRIQNTGLTWYLEIDANNKTKCDINGKEITIGEDKKIIGADPSGLKKVYNNYWFEITQPTKNFTISCDLDFITTLLYQKPGSPVYYISSETQSAPAYDSVTEGVEAYCFGTSNNCDYEGSLWAVLALSKLDEDISSYLPYLSAMSDEALNKKYLASAFLYILTGADDYYSSLVNQQKQNNYWDEGKNKFYDTSIALLAIQGLSVEEADNAKEYLLKIRENSGCWSSYTSFILHAGWPKNPLVTSGGGDDSVICEGYGYFCTSVGDCELKDRLDNFVCPSLSETCCSAEPIEETCLEKGGIICSGDEECSGSEVISSDENNCCLGDCEVIEEEDYCTDVEGYVCKNSCDDNQEEKSFYVCDFGEVCCADKAKSGANWWLIILLIILIILVILAIIFRNQLKIWFFRIKSNFKSSKGPKPSDGRPAGFMVPRPRMPMGVGRPMIPRRYAPNKRLAPERNARDKDFDETMKKLRDMSE